MRKSPPENVSRCPLSKGKAILEMPNSGQLLKPTLPSSWGKTLKVAGLITLIW
jgi:hypothetical protein